MAIVDVRIQDRDRRESEGIQAREATLFLLVGTVGTVIDLGMFNAVLVSGSQLSPMLAKVLAVATAASVTYLGHRTFTWGGRDHRCHSRQLPGFLLLNLLGLGVALSCLAISRHVLGLDGVIADNLAANVVGVALAGSLRFWGYRTLVFPR